MEGLNGWMALPGFMQVNNRPHPGVISSCRQIQSASPSDSPTTKASIRRRLASDRPDGVAHPYHRAAEPMVRRGREVPKPHHFSPRPPSPVREEDGLEPFPGPPRRQATFTTSSSWSSSCNRKCPRCENFLTPSDSSGGDATYHCPVCSVWFMVRPGSEPVEAQAGVEGVITTTTNPPHMQYKKASKWLQAGTSCSIILETPL